MNDAWKTTAQDLSSSIVIKNHVLFYFLFVVALAIFFCSDSRANNESSFASITKINVANAGVALSGSANLLNKKFPHLSQLITSLDKTVIEKTRTLNPHHYHLLSDTLGNTRAGDSLSVALVIDSESAAYRSIGGIHQIIVDIVANIVVFDFDEEERAVIAAYPVQTTPCIESFESKPTSQQVFALVKSYLFEGLCGEPSLVDSYSQQLFSLNIQQKLAGEIAIRNVTINDSAKQLLPDTMRQNEVLAQHYLATSISRNLTRNKQLSVIPYQSDNAHAKFSMRFTGSTDDILLSLPEPDYVFDIHLKALGKKLVEETTSGRSYIYATRINIRFFDALLDEEKPLFNRDIKNGIAVILASSQDFYDEWLGYSAAITGLFYRFSENLHKPSEKWRKLQKLDKTAEESLKVLNQRLELIAL